MFTHHIRKMYGAVHWTACYMYVLEGVLLGDSPSRSPGCVINRRSRRSAYVLQYLHEHNPLRGRDWPGSRPALAFGRNAAVTRAALRAVYCGNRDSHTRHPLPQADAAAHVRSPPLTCPAAFGAHEVTMATAAPVRLARALTVSLVIQDWPRTSRAG